MSEERKVRFTRLRKSSLKTARAWALKDTAQKIWSTTNRSCVLKDWNHYISWAKRCRLEPMKNAAKTIESHLWGIVNAMVLQVSNRPSESMNSRIKTVKARARGFRNVDRFIHAIYFYLGRTGFISGLHPKTGPPLKAMKSLFF